MRIKIIPIICIYVIVIALVLLITPLVPDNKYFYWWLTCLVTGILIAKIVRKHFIE